MKEPAGSRKITGRKDREGRCRFNLRIRLLPACGDKREGVQPCVALRSETMRYLNASPGLIPIILRSLAMGQNPVKEAWIMLAPTNAVIHNQ
jgi:hypothetical protein